MSGTGIFRLLKAYLQNNRLGDLLVLKGIISQETLDHALTLQVGRKRHLGVILLQEKLITKTQLRRTLTEQWAARGLATVFALFISFASLSIKPTRAGASERPVGELILASTGTSGAVNEIGEYPRLFGFSEKSSRDLSAFSKWTGMFRRFETSMNSPQNSKIMVNWKSDLRTVGSGSIETIARKVNTEMNDIKYIPDNKNYGTSDYWATPIEFLKRGGDCEDYAIAKYASLRALGVPEERMRLAIVKDTWKNIHHALLIVYADTGTFVLDNQDKSMKEAHDVKRYRPIFSLNRTGWWLHSSPGEDLVASR